MPAVSKKIADQMKFSQVTQQKNFMTIKSISLIYQRTDNRMQVIPAHALSPSGALADTSSRLLCYLQTSTTDPCNFLYTYCMLKSMIDKIYQFSSKCKLLCFEEITGTTHLFFVSGIKKIRLTSGELLLCKILEIVIKILVALKTDDGQPLDLTLTPNASLLAKKAQRPNGRVCSVSLSRSIRSKKLYLAP
jgi:cyclic pyranopterin phosphate synthase